MRFCCQPAIGIISALDEVLSSGDRNALKSIVLISDGGTEHSGDILSYDREVPERAKEENVRIYTVFIGTTMVRQRDLVQDQTVVENLENYVK